VAEIIDGQGLLLTAVQDLYDAECAMIERLPAIAEYVSDPTLARLLADDVARSREQAERLAGIARDLGDKPKGPANIWLRAILDDADRDIRSTAAGVLLDIALVGAIRKGKHAECVSYETAIALADALSRAEDSQLLQASRDEEERTDSGLQRLLHVYCADVSPQPD
jgi:ferritin-like metal-binding protein YciE